MRLVWQSPGSSAAVVLIAGMNLVFNALTPVLVLRAELGAGPTGIGLMSGVYGAGGILGAWSPPGLHRLVPGRLILVGVARLWAGRTRVGGWRMW